MRILFFLVNLVICVNAYSQVSVEIKTGITFPFFKDHINKTGYQIDNLTPGVTILKTGIKIQKPGKFIAFAMDAEYTRKGFQYQSSKLLTYNTWYKNDTKYFLDYLLFSFYPEVMLLRPDYLYLHLGICLGPLVSAREIGTVTTTCNPPTCEEVLIKTKQVDHDILDLTNGFETGGIIGFGCRIPISNSIDLIIEGNFVFGLSEVFYEKQRWGSLKSSNHCNVLFGCSINLTK